MRVQGFLFIALLSTAVYSQVAAPNLINNQVLNAALKEKLLTEECKDVSTLRATKDIENQALINHKFNTARISKDRADTHSRNEVVTEALKEAVKTPGTLASSATKTDDWNDKSAVKYVQEVVFAVANDKTVDYYHLDFHLSVQTQLQDSPDNYKLALKSYKCKEIKEWITHYFQ